MPLFTFTHPKHHLTLTKIKNTHEDNRADNRSPKGIAKILQILCKMAKRSIALYLSDSRPLFVEAPVAADLRNTPCAPNDFFVLDCNRCRCNHERTGYICSQNICPSGTVQTPTRQNNSTRSASTARQEISVSTDLNENASSSNSRKRRHLSRRDI